MDVISYGISAHDDDAYYLIRAYNSLSHLKTAQDTFYDSEAWRHGPRQAICSGQLKLATALEFFQYRFSDSFGGNPPL